MKKDSSQQEFDAFATSYDEALRRGVSLSGEDKTFFAINRIRWLLRTLKQSGKGWRILDFGCGTGTSCPFLLDTFDAQEVVGVDVSRASIETARAEHQHPKLRFVVQEDWGSEPPFDLAFCNGVFHHIPVPERGQAMDFIFHAVKPGGYFALWENNPWNPGTHWVMARIPFDRDAVKLFPREARRRLKQAGFNLHPLTFAFIFPKWLAWLRPLEPTLASLPLGAQYQALAQKPNNHAE